MVDEKQVKLILKDGDKVYELPVEKLGALIKAYGKEVEDKGIVDTVLDWF